MLLEKIPAILLIVLGMHIALRAPTPPTPKSQRCFGDGPVGINWLAGGHKLDKGEYIRHIPDTTKATDLYRGRILDMCSHRTLHHCRRHNEVRVRLVKASYGPPVAKW